MNFKRAYKGRNTASLLMLFFVALAFAVKALLPAGFMPVVNKDGFTQIVICSGMGEKTITVPSDEAPSQEHQETSSDKVCAYQVLASAKPLLSPPNFVLPAPPILRDDFVSLDDTAPTTFTILSFDARGPPLA